LHARVRFGFLALKLAETAHGMFLLQRRGSFAAPLHNRNRRLEGLKNPLMPGFLPRPVA
jgi:hypothetical protein